MTTDGDVGLVCRSIFMKPGMSMTESEGEAGENRAEAVGVEGAVCVTLQRAPGRDRGPGA